MYTMYIIIQQVMFFLNRFKFIVHKQGTMGLGLGNIFFVFSLYSY